VTGLRPRWLAGAERNQGERGDNAEDDQRGQRGPGGSAETDEARWAPGGASSWKRCKFAAQALGEIWRQAITAKGGAQGGAKLALEGVEYVEVSWAGHADVSREELQGRAGRSS